MTIFEQLKEDHGKQRGLAGGIENTQGDSAERKRLWKAYQAELVAHASAEEQTLYATLLGRPDGQSKAQHSVAEHKVMEDIAEELNSMDMSSTGWLTRFKTLRDKVDHHLAEEEEDIFPLAEELLSRADLDSLSNDFAERKQRELETVE